MSDHVECICGADIHLVDVKDGFKVWLDSRGNPFCYPGVEGRDGSAQHEPLESPDEGRS